MIRRWSKRAAKILFVTGTDTGVGKTLLTALLLHHLRAAGRHALAVKPFCSGGRIDAELLQAAQDNELDIETVNPFYFSKPVAPWAASRRSGRAIPLSEVVRRLEESARGCEVLLIEGSGGLLVPLDRNYFVADVIHELDCETIVVARNQLGTLNHTLLTMRALPMAKRKKASVVLMDTSNPDASSRTNRPVLAELLKPIEVFAVPFLGENANEFGALKNNCRKIKKTLARLSESYRL